MMTEPETIDAPHLTDRLVRLVDSILAATPDGALYHGAQVNAGTYAITTDAVMWFRPNNRKVIQRSTYPTDAGREYSVGLHDIDGACTELFANDRDGLRFRTAKEGATAEEFLAWFEGLQPPTDTARVADGRYAHLPVDTPGLLTEIVSV